MSVLQKNVRLSLVTAATTLALLSAGCSTMEKMGEKVGIGSKKPAAELSGDQEVPPVSTKATGESTVAIADDRSVSGSVIVHNMTPTAAHIHQGAAKTSGPVIIPLTKTGANTFSVPANTKLTDAQYSAYKDGDLYVNVHSAAHPNGEVRLQLKP